MAGAKVTVDDRDVLAMFDRLGDLGGPIAQREFLLDAGAALFNATLDRAQA